MWSSLIFILLYSYFFVVLLFLFYYQLIDIHANVMRKYSAVYRSIQCAQYILLYYTIGKCKCVILPNSNNNNIKQYYYYSIYEYTTYYDVIIYQYTNINNISYLYYRNMLVLCCTRTLVKRQKINKKRQDFNYFNFRF